MQKHASAHTPSELHLQQVVIVFSGGGEMRAKEKSFPAVHHWAIRVLSVPDAHHPQQRYGDSIQDLRTPRETQQDTERGVTTSLDAAGAEHWTHMCVLTHTHTHARTHAHIQYTHGHTMDTHLHAQIQTHSEGRHKDRHFHHLILQNCHTYAKQTPWILISLILLHI